MHVYIYAPPIRQRTKNKNGKNDQKSCFPIPVCQCHFFTLKPSTACSARSPLKRCDHSCCCTSHRSSATTLTAHELLLSISHVLLAVDYIRTYVNVYVQQQELSLDEKIIDGSSRQSLGGMYVFSGRLRSEHTASRAGLHHVDGGREAAPPRGSEVREHVREKTTRRHRRCRWAMCPNAHRARFFGDLVVDLDVEASRARYGAERADQLSRRLQARRGHASAKKPRGEAVRGGRYPQT